MPIYEVKLTYKYADYVTIEAESEKEALDTAHLNSNDAQYESLYDAEILATKESPEKPEG